MESLPLLAMGAIPAQGGPESGEMAGSGTVEHLVPVPAGGTAREVDPRGHFSRWIVSASAGGATLVAIHVLVTWGKLEPSQLLAVAILVSGVLLGVVNAVLEWRATTFARAFDDVLVICAALVYATPGLALLARGHVSGFSQASLAPLGVLVVVWASRALETALGARLDRHPDIGSVHSPASLAGLFFMPERVGSSLFHVAGRRIGRTLSLMSLPVGGVVVALAWGLGGRLGDPAAWAVAAAVSLSLAPRLARNVMPAVVAAGVVNARSRGITFRDDAEVEKAGAADALILRKRGVLVEPGGEVIEYHHMGSLPSGIVLALVASCEGVANGTEPAEALMRFARREGVKPGDTRLTRWIASRGVQSTSPFGEVFVGNRLFLIENGISVGRGEDVAQEAEKRGHTAVFVSVDRDIQAVAVLQNRVRPGARPAVDACRRLGVTSVLVTGDSFRTAESIGQSLGVDQIRSEIAVGSRENEIDRLRDMGYTLAVLGHVDTGVEQAVSPGDLNMALGWDGESCLDTRWGVAARGDDPMGAVDALDIGRRVRRFLLVNRTLAVVGGGLVLGLAASGLASPFWAALGSNLLAAIMLAIRPSTGGTE